MILAHVLLSCLKFSLCNGDLEQERFSALYAYEISRNFTEDQTRKPSKLKLINNVHASAK